MTKDTTIEDWHRGKTKRIWLHDRVKEKWDKESPEKKKCSIKNLKNNASRFKQNKDVLEWQHQHQPHETRNIT